MSWKLPGRPGHEPAPRPAAGGAHLGRLRPAPDDPVLRTVRVLDAAGDRGPGSPAGVARPNRAILMAAGWFLVMNVLQPRIMQDAVGIHPIVVLGSVLIGGRIAGIAGAISGSRSRPSCRPSSSSSCIGPRVTARSPAGPRNGCPSATAGRSASRAGTDTRQCRRHRGRRADPAECGVERRPDHRPIDHLSTDR